MKKENEVEDLKKRLKKTQEAVLIALLVIGVTLSYLIFELS